jgi:S1-C subfamily serine protease
MSMQRSGYRRAGCNWLAAGVLAGLTLGTHAQVPINLLKDTKEGPAAADIRRDATVAAIERVMPSVVNIATSRIVEYHDFYDELRRQFFGLPPQRKPHSEEQLDSLGSGVIIDEDGYILTNLHVVRRGTRVQVKLADGRVFEADKIVATESSDVALLKLRAKPGEKFKAIKLATDDDLLLGETVLALGNPFGLGGSVSRGILSSKNRRPATGNEPLNIADWLQTDAAINPGNSGGPLVNLNGELIGINVAVYREGQGIGFAIPVRQVSAALAQFFSPEVKDSMWFGAQLRVGPAPLTIAEVQDGSPAAQAGLKSGMQIAQVNGKTPGSVVEFSELLRPSIESREVALAVLDVGKRRNLTVKLEPFADLVKARLGLTLQPATADNTNGASLSGGQGLVIQSVEKDGPAEQAQLKPGMLVVGFDSTAVNEVRDLGLALTGKKAKEDTAKLTLIVMRPIGNRFVQQVQATAELKLRR